MEIPQNLDLFRLLWHCTEGNGCLERRNLRLATLSVQDQSRSYYVWPSVLGQQILQPCVLKWIRLDILYTFKFRRHWHSQILLYPTLWVLDVALGTLYMIWVYTSRVSEVPGVPTRGKVRLERRGRRKREDWDRRRWQESPSSDLYSVPPSQELSEVARVTNDSPEMHSRCLAVLIDERDRGAAFVWHMGRWALKKWHIQWHLNGSLPSSVHVD